MVAVVMVECVRVMFERLVQTVAFSCSVSYSSKMSGCEKNWQERPFLYSFPVVSAFFSLFSPVSPCCAWLYLAVVEECITL